MQLGGPGSVPGEHGDISDRREGSCCAAGALSGSRNVDGGNGQCDILRSGSFFGGNKEGGLQLVTISQPLAALQILYTSRRMKLTG